MALNPIDEAHLAQIKAGTTGRTRGHDFEKTLTADLNGLVCDSRLWKPMLPATHLFRGWPAEMIVRYIVDREKFPNVVSVKAWWLGGLATSGLGDVLVDGEGKAIAASKSDVVIEIVHDAGKLAAGVSVKTCSKKTPTNDQLYFTTAIAFCSLLRRNGIPVSEDAEKAMRMFCGDAGYRPRDNSSPVGRIADPNRWFWEELPDAGRKEWEALFTNRQRQISTILLQKAYPADPYAPSYLLHQTVKYDDPRNCPMALFSIDELLDHTCKVGAFSTKDYVIKKGTYKHDPNTHQAPRFGFIQFQRAGNKQHPTQLQFNLQAGYFNKLPLLPLAARP